MVITWTANLRFICLAAYNSPVNSNPLNFKHGFLNMAYVDIVFKANTDSILFCSKWILQHPEFQNWVLMPFWLQVRAGSRALYRPLSASVVSRPEVRTGEVSGWDTPFSSAKCTKGMGLVRLLIFLVNLLLKLTHSISSLVYETACVLRLFVSPQATCDVNIPGQCGSPASEPLLPGSA